MKYCTAFLVAVVAISVFSCSDKGDKPSPAAKPAETAQPDYAIGALRFYDLRATGGIRGGSAAAYVTIANSGPVPDTLTSASSPACGTTELHEMVDVDGVRTMHATAYLVVNPSESISLKPGGTHIMLMDLRDNLRKSDSIDIVLNFARAGAVTVRTRVR